MTEFFGEMFLGAICRRQRMVAISPRRLLALDEEKQTVTFAWRDYADGGRRKTMALETKELRSLLFPDVRLLPKLCYFAPQFQFHYLTL